MNSIKQYGRIKNEGDCMRKRKLVCAKKYHGSFLTHFTVSDIFIVLMQ